MASVAKPDILHHSDYRQRRFLGAHNASLITHDSWNNYFGGKQRITVNTKTEILFVQFYHEIYDYGYWEKNVTNGRTNVVLGLDDILHERSV